MRLQHKVAVVTGGGSGLGRAMSLLFAREGARVVVADRDAAGAEATVAQIAAQMAEQTPEQATQANPAGDDAGGVAVAAPADVTDVEQVRAMLELAVERFGQLDILVNNAGIGEGGPIAELDEAVWDRVLRVNLTAVFYCSKYAWPHLARTRGAILNIASVAGLVGERNLGAYAASKGGVVQLTKVLALEGARQGIRANALCPVFIATPMLEGYTAGSPDPEAALRHILRGIPLRRVGTPDDVAYAALYLVSDEASFITGVAFPVDGGALAQ